MAKDKTQTSKARRYSAPQKRRNSTSNGQAEVRAKRSRWDPAEISAEFTLSDTVLESELKTVEAFLFEQINELLGRNRRSTNKSREKTR